MQVNSIIVSRIIWGKNNIAFNIKIELERGYPSKLDLYQDNLEPYLVLICNTNTN